MKYLRWLLLPFSLIYALVVLLRNWFYDAGLFKSLEFDMPVISVGNLDVGGAGKSPMTEYLIRLLKNEHQLATLSRGYGRKTKGFLTAAASATATDIGDEPAQFSHKFPEVTVAVCEDRVAGIEQLKTSHNLIILDDAYQHRAVKPGLSILLFDYNKLYDTRFVLPAGNLREPFSGKWRADIMVITKCPPALTEEEMTRCYYRVNPQSFQPLFFSTINYLPLQDMQQRQLGYKIEADTTVFLLTGIANPKPLVTHLKMATQHIIHHNYPDHHPFTLKNIAKLAAEFAACKAQKKVIITTEKDAQRLGVHDLLPEVSRLFILVIPIGISFLGDGQHNFDKLITDYVRKYSK
ncbi:tetraacyldisaccharide 4'-kinase [Mucilaginibacter psychrotolerans]|uniref:Tetraacyldisaccharide 4'-kinase n=1 Tax=Mucilaginibacter psychrotolerans TaxID=1524096 RepID=A0A4Y8S9F7_9SPHI|nr:tetraacyldisaccharide 4'-kinase [Mucilaginibacter psychrotolerans]TFF35026.1 tetraacyldisaccharide 4'-kinase [Mucilaginibacter psychrotolerans]